MTQLEKLVDIHARLIDAFHDACMSCDEIAPAPTRDLIHVIDLLVKQAEHLEGSDSLAEHLGLDAPKIN